MVSLQLIKTQKVKKDWVRQKTSRAYQMFMFEIKWETPLLHQHIIEIAFNSL